MPLPQVSKQVTKIISLSFFAVVSVMKLLCVFILSGETDSACIAGWHVNEELSNHILLLSIGIIPDVIMLVCIGIGMAFKSSNIGADPGSIIYNFIVGLLAVCSIFPYLGVENCRSDSLTMIKAMGICASIAGVLQIANGVVCLVCLALEEKV